MLNWRTRDIVCTSFAKGKTHDFKLLQTSNVHLHPECFWLADSGYQGLQKLHQNTELPHKKRKGWELEPEEKRYNKALAKLRLSIEHVNCKLKVFKILSGRYGGRRRCFGLRFNLISGFYNFELKLKTCLLQ